MGGITMNENLDLTKILEGCPKGTKFYSSNCGEIFFNRIIPDAGYQILFDCCDDVYTSCTKEGFYLTMYKDAECTVFPSKDQRDWSKFERFWDKPKSKTEKFKFDPKTLQPFDKVLVRDYSNEYWRVDLFGFMKKNFINDFSCCCCDTNWRCCIPYNEETKYLIGTNKDCPEYYKWWEE